jgi:hypothetical protein
VLLACEINRLHFVVMTSAAVNIRLTSHGGSISCSCYPQRGCRETDRRTDHTHTTHSPSLTLTHARAHTHIHTLSCTHSHTHTLTHAHTLSHTHTHSHTHKTSLYCHVR